MSFIRDDDPPALVSAAVLIGLVLVFCFMAVAEGRCAPQL